MSRRGVILTDRDKRLLVYFALARYLTVDQVHLLLGATHVPRLTYRRLFRLSQPNADGKPYLQPHDLRKSRGTPAAVWSLSDFGWREVEQLLPYRVDRPASDLGLQSLAHQIFLNQLFVDLVEHLRRSPTDPIAELPFRWIPESTGQLTFKMHDARTGFDVQTAVKPDAIVEAPTVRRRFFIEAETGSKNITSNEQLRFHAGSITRKLQRYATYFTGLETQTLKTTWYGRTFTDNYFPELLFLVHSPARKDRVAWIVSRRLAEIPEPHGFMARVLTLDEAAAAMTAVIASKPVPRTRLLTVPESIGTEIQQTFNELISSYNAVIEAVNAHNKSAPAHKVSLPPAPTDTILRLKKLIREQLFGTPTNPPKWSGHLIEHPTPPANPRRSA